MAARLRKVPSAFVRGFCKGLSKGQRVVISGLVDAPQYNGKEAVLLDLPKMSPGRCEVKLDNTLKTLNLSTSAVSPILPTNTSSSSSNPSNADPALAPPILSSSGNGETGLVDDTHTLLVQAFPTHLSRRCIRERYMKTSVVSVPSSATMDEILHAVSHMRLAHSPLARFLFRNMATFQVESSNAPEAGEMCTFDSLGEMGWLRLGKRTDVISPYPARRPPPPEVPGQILTRDSALTEDSKRDQLESAHRIPKNEIGFGRLLPPMGREAPVLYGPTDWHKFRWACDDYPWVSKLAVSVIIEDVSRKSTSDELKESGERRLRVRTEMWLENTSYLAHW
eukprot:CAMPEP_0184491862 /NCGR_PEP_ID=MMETSP0113_2-20130426/21540_1 /TAXON_ID=91329 /ORGANISM="Norrisiella sphaerica, Strain BC52" /LENGTH=336 /DNA_ID=CAMNT_0026876403 /DNA_START=55 /DNA_END=1062 /DNA_ORIENTATION=-